MFLKKLFGTGKPEATVGGTPSNPVRRGMDNVTFTVDWPAASTGRTGEFEDAYLLLTDVAPLSAGDVLAIKNGILSRTSTPAVLIAPAFMPDALPMLTRENLYGVVAGDVGVQRLDELLLDLAMLTRGKTLSAAFGIGLPKPPAHGKTPGGLVIPGTDWSDFKPDGGDLGIAHKVTIGEQALTVETSVSSSELSRHLANLLTQFQQAITGTDREATARRFARFGRSPGQPPTVEDYEFPDDAIRIPGGYASLFFMTDAGAGCADWRNPHLLITDSELTSISQLAGPLDFAVANKLMPLAVIAPRIRQGALAFLVLNKMLGILDAVGLQVALTPPAAADALNRLARTTGTTVIKSLTYTSSVSLSSFGRASRLVATRGWTLVSPSPAQ